MAGVIREGCRAGGCACGYRPVPGAPGKMEIVEVEAMIVHRIFARYAAGDTPREIATALNAERVPPPRGKFWRASVITGSRKRQNGILQNELYVGRLVWNRVRMIKDPDTGRRVSRPNPEDEWQREDAPRLRLWQAVRAACRCCGRNEIDCKQRSPSSMSRPRSSRCIRPPLSSICETSIDWPSSSRSIAMHVTPASRTPCAR